MEEIAGGNKVLSDYEPPWGTEHRVQHLFSFTINWIFGSYGFILGQHRDCLLSLVSLPFLPVSLRPTFKFSPTPGSWYHPGLPGKVKVFGMSFLAPSWCLWLLESTGLRRGKNQISERDGEPPSSRHAHLHEP